MDNAMCINQNNLQERGEQVVKMGDILQDNIKPKR